jgi:hypothetical protein
VLPAASAPGHRAHAPKEPLPSIPHFPPATPGTVWKVGRGEVLTER